MRLRIGRRERRIGITINFAALALFLVVAYLGRFGGFSAGILVAAVAFLLGVLVTFVRYFIQTGAWRLVHSPMGLLDERQVQVTRESLRRAYSIFSIVVLVFLLVEAVVAVHDPNLIFVFATLLYTAHTLPASILAWTELEL